MQKIYQYKQHIKQSNLIDIQIGRTTIGNVRVKFPRTGNTSLVKGQLKKLERHSPKYLKFLVPSIPHLLTW